MSDIKLNSFIGCYNCNKPAAYNPFIGGGYSPMCENCYKHYRKEQQELAKPNCAKCDEPSRWHNGKQYLCDKHYGYKNPKNKQLT
jgi:hypothetical protein